MRGGIKLNGSEHALSSARERCRSSLANNLGRRVVFPYPFSLVHVFLWFGPCLPVRYSRLIGASSVRLCYQRRATVSALGSPENRCNSTEIGAKRASRN